MNILSLGDIIDPKTNRLMRKDSPCKQQPKERWGGHANIRQQILSQKLLQETKRLFIILISESIHQEDVTVIYTYTPNSRNSKYMKQKLSELEGEIVLQSQLETAVPYFQ